MQLVKFILFIIVIASVAACKQKASTPPPAIDPVRAELEYIKPIPGDDDTLLQEHVQKGKVLIAYSDCHTCHTEKSRAKGPAFEDIAQRYPINDGYIELLARKIIVGGSGAWGYPVMSAHPHVTVDEAKLMVMYILSLKQSR